MSSIEVTSSTQTVVVEEVTQTVIVDSVTSTPIVITDPTSAISIVNSGPVGPRGLTGATGSTGPTGPSGTTVTYTHVQNTPSAAWAIAHNLGAKPTSVLVIDGGGTMIVGEVVYVDDNNVTIVFDIPPFAGTAYLN